MALDLTLRHNAFRLRVSKIILENQSLIIREEHLRSSLKHSFFFGHKFGLGACFSKCGEDDDFNYYTTNPIDRGCRETVKQIIGTYDLLSHAVQHFINIESFDCNLLFPDQSFTLQTSSGNDLSGKLFPWFVQKMTDLDEQQVLRLNHYVRDESSQFYRDWYRSKTEPKIFILPNSFNIKVEDNAQSLHWTNNQSGGPYRTFSSSGARSAAEQEKNFVAFIHLNTWLRAAQ
ncbi:MAG: hypothetical protein Q8Q67_01215 [bacterium]|nr:hypothetical protein [bacterium]